MQTPSELRSETTHTVGASAFLAQFETPAPMSAERQAELDRDADEQCREMRRRVRRAYVREFFGPVIIDTDWQHPDLKPNHSNIERVRSWKFGPRGLLIAGAETGTGKTRSLAALVMRVYAEELIGAALWNSQELFARITQTNSFGRDFAKEFIDGLTRPSVLVIDDLGQEATSRGQEAQVQQWFFRLLDLRASAGLPCLITTNHTAETLANSPKRAISADPLIRRLLAVAEPVKFKAPRP
jgi:DNA replication protein DnaC